LIIDGHNSHISGDFMVSCVTNRVFLCCLPAYTSHVIQPLDVSVFSSLKHNYRRGSIWRNLVTKTLDQLPASKPSYIVIRKEAPRRWQLAISRPDGKRQPIAISKPLNMSMSMSTEKSHGEVSYSDRPLYF